MKRFNTETVCNPKTQYMVDVSEKAAQAIRGIRQGKHYVISRPRQYGKTNMLVQLMRMLREEYYVLFLDLEDATEDEFASDASFVGYIEQEIGYAMAAAGCPEDMQNLWGTCCSPAGGASGGKSFSSMGRNVSLLCGAADRGIVLLMDEADKCAGSGMLLKFLKMLRLNELGKLSGRDYSFQSVIFAGVSDMRNRKAEGCAAGTEEQDNPWDSAEDFPADLSFSSEEIAGMLREYEADHGTGMDTAAVSQEIHRLSAGYPLIVSWLCQWLDTKGDGSWTAESVGAAGKAFLRSGCWLLTGVRGMVERHVDLKDMLTQMLCWGAAYPLEPDKTAVVLAQRCGILTADESGCIRIANPLIEEYLHAYLAEAL